MLLPIRPRGLHLVLLAALFQLACHSAPLPNPRNKPPFGIVDTPKSQDTVGRVVDVTGWVLDDSGVKNVKGFVDGEYQASAMPTLARPDVARAYPRYAREGDRYGWSLRLDLGEREGSHTILVKAADDQGATGDIGVAVVNLIGR